MSGVLRGKIFLRILLFFSLFMVSWESDFSISTDSLVLGSSPGANKTVINGVEYEADANGPYMWCHENRECKNEPDAESNTAANCSNVVTEEKCRLQSTEHRLYCFYVIPVKDGILTKEGSIKGCFSQNSRGHNYCEKNECIGRPRGRSAGDPQSYYCCCNSSFCNFDMTSMDNDTDTGLSEADFFMDEDALPTYLQLQYIVAMIAATVLIIGVLASLCWWYYRRRALSRARAAATPPGDDVERLLIAESSQESLNIADLEAIGRGRFGEVYRGTLGDIFVAVKVFPRMEMHSWKAEKEIYCTVGMQDHENVLRYVGSEMRGAVFWLVTEYHERGSLFQYLGAHTLTFRDGLKLINSVLSGLAFLHEEKTMEHGIKKPCVVHRDFKSRNVLLKNDLTAAIGDFGLALICEDGKSPAEGTRGQVGTKRYMSPEVLEGATEFTAFAFRQIDVYAAALVLWEVLQRTVLYDGDEAEPYRQPYEDELGADPTIHELRTAVVKDKLRPLIRKSVFACKFGCDFWKMIEEMWNAEPDGRITAGCAADRVQRLYDSIITGDPSPNAPSAEEAGLSSMYNVREEDPLVPKNQMNELDFQQMYAPPNQHPDVIPNYTPSSQQHVDVIPNLFENLYPIIKNGYNQNNLVHPVGAAKM